jgi:hypothetical protein
MAHLTHEELKGYEAGTLANSALVVADRHLADCAVCRYELRRTTAAPELPEIVREMGEPVHLTYDEMTAYVDAKIDDAARERMNEHAAICKSCSKELRDLQVFDARMNVEMNTVPAAQVEAGPSWLKQAMENMGQFFATPRRLSFAGAGVGLMLLGVFSLLHVQMKEGAAQSGSGVMAQVTLLSASTHPEIFYGGFLIAGVGLIALLYGLFKK